MKKAIKKLPKSHRQSFIRWEKGGLKSHLEYMESVRAKGKKKAIMKEEK